MKIIYGLGNPGRSYERNRHNVGFMVVDHLAKKWGISLKRKKAQVLFGAGKAAGVEVMLAKPQTYMNLSGLPLDPLHVDAGDLIVIHDDMDIPFGQVRIKKSGGTGGHRGLESIRGVLCTGDFIRIRVGIGRPPSDMDPSDYVLVDIPHHDRDILSGQIDKAAAAVEMCLKGEVAMAMNTFNRREVKADGQE